MKKLLIILFLLPLSIFAQQDDAALKREARKLVREGNELYNQAKFADAEVAYKKALQKDPNSETANYNLGNALSQQNRGKEAIAKYELVAKTTKDNYTLAEAMHNIGNTHYQDKNYQGAVDAYKNSLRANPKDDETRYNLALAQMMLKNQQQQNKDNKDNKDDKKDNKDNKDDKNKDKKDDKKKDGDDKKDNKNKDDKDKKDDKKDGDDKDDKKDPNKDKKDDKQEQKPQPGKLSPQQVKQLLEAMNNEEQKTQKKMNAKKERGKKIKQEKDW